MAKLTLIIFFILIVPFKGINSQDILPGAYSTKNYLQRIEGKKVALVANHTSLIDQNHLLDTLLSLGIEVKRVFCPEHGFRGDLEAGEKVKHEIDKKTGVKIVSLYGKHYKPRTNELSDIDIVLFDIQDVGVRCYTYLSTLHYVMEACAENHIQLIILDRPNPNGFYTDGPVLELKCRSFVGLHPVPLVYGMTIGEYAQMINGEKWLKNEVVCDLIIIPCQNYSRYSRYILPIKPSPNLRDMQAVYLYPSLALFEGSVINVGRGTYFPFKVFGHPLLQNSNFTFVPQCKNVTMKPMHCDTVCYGIDLREYQLPDTNLFSLKWLIWAYNNYPDKNGFFNRFFYNLSGNKHLREQIEAGKSEDEIKPSWKDGLDNFNEMKIKYLIYK